MSIETFERIEELMQELELELFEVGVNRRKPLTEFDSVKICSIKSLIRELLFNK